VVTVPSVSEALLAPVLVVAAAPVDADLAGQTGSRDVLSRERILGAGAASLADLLDGAIPGLWLWNTGPGSLAANFGSLRGASSFGMSVPKVYVDGIEVANPLLLGRLSPESLEEIEVIRGPQGTALYGSDAIGGVIKIRTRRPAGIGDGTRLQLTSSAGHVGSAYAPFGALTQDHALSVHGGSSTRSFTSVLSAGSVGAYAPGAFGRQLAASVAASFTGNSTQLDVSGRFHSGRARSGWGDLSGLSAAPASVEPTAVTTYTVGTHFVLARGTTWTHTAVAGIDGYAMYDVALSPLSRINPSDSALGAARGRGDRASLRVTSVARFGDDAARSATLTLGLDHSLLRDGTARSAATPGSGAEWRHSLGAIAQAAVALRGSWFANAGLRLEHSSGLIAQDLATALPSLGVGYVRRAGPVSVRLRGAYGKAMRAPRAFHTGASALLPEQQQGVEAGADVHVGDRLSVRFTAFDQRASGLVQPVADATTIFGFDGPTRRTSASLRNVGAIANRGWELQASGTRGALQLHGALSRVDSRVARVASGYVGDLREGDRMLAVPAIVASLGATWVGHAWSGSLGATRASDWINYDWLTIARDAQASSLQALGPRLRSYWIGYDGTTRLRADFTRDLSRGLSFVFSGDNLLGTQRGELDNLSILPGRTLRAGIRATF
jgi:iron complex outermembrane receptor protein